MRKIDLLKTTRLNFDFSLFWQSSIHIEVGLILFLSSLQMKKDGPKDF